MENNPTLPNPSGGRCLEDKLEQLFTHACDSGQDELVARKEVLNQLLGAEDLSSA